MIIQFLLFFTGSFHLIFLQYGILFGDTQLECNQKVKLFLIK